MTTTGGADAGPVVDLVDIEKHYTTGPVSNYVLRNVNAQIARGELCAITGPSGSGKSTLMHILGLLDQPTSGRYALNGRAVDTMNDDARATERNRSIGFVFQSFHLLARANAWQNVALPLVYARRPRGQIRAQAEQMLAKVGLGDRSEHRPGELSGGQRQRVAIARALVTGPTLLLADEPTGALDTRTGEEIMALFGELNASEGVTAVVITHDPGIAKRCHRELRMHHGTLRERERRSPPGRARS